VRLAIIPARGGSKRIPKKNIKSFNGKPIIAWSIEVARNSDCFDTIIVSTDDDETAQIAKEWGATVPFIRPANLADDYTGTIPVIRHAIEWFLEQGQTPKQVCCIYATAPFITVDTLNRGLKLLIEKDCDYVFTVTSYNFPIQRAFRITSETRIEMFYPEHFYTRSQDLEEAYHDAGQFYWGTASAWLEGRSVYANGSVPLLLTRNRVQDIDTMEDWEQAEHMFRIQTDNE